MKIILSIVALLASINHLYFSPGKPFETKVHKKQSLELAKKKLVQIASGFYIKKNILQLLQDLYLIDMYTTSYMLFTESFIQKSNYNKNNKIINLPKKNII